MPLDTLISDETRLFSHNGLNYRIQFHHDHDASNPWEDSEGCVPCIVSFGRGDVREWDDGHDIGNPIDAMTPEYITRNRGRIAAAFGSICDGWQSVDISTKDKFDEFVRGEHEFDYHGPIADYRKELFSEWLNETPWNGDKMDLVADLWKMQGVPAERQARNGYCQGDYFDALFVAHPDAIKAWGFDSMKAYLQRCGDTFDREADTMAAWAFGGVIGYVVERIDPREIALAELDLSDADSDDLNALEYCEDVDSCWGFFPDMGQHAWDLDVNHATAMAEAYDAAVWDAVERNPEDS